MQNKFLKNSLNFLHRYLLFTIHVMSSYHVMSCYKIYAHFTGQILFCLHQLKLDNAAIFQLHLSGGHSCESFNLVALVVCKA